MIVVTGASGLIGSHLLDKLVREEHEVVGTARSLRNYVSPRKIALVDHRDKVATDKLFQNLKPEIVFHCAANVAEGKSQKFPVDITQNNMGIFINVLTAAVRSGVKRFIFLSSNAVYGEIPTPYKETDTPKPQDLYAVNKLASEEALKILSKAYGFEYVILRPHNVYGPRQYMRDKYKNVVMLFLNQILRGEPYKLFGDGKLQRNFSFVEDVVDVIYKAGFGDYAGETFNVGSDIPTSIKELSDTIQKVTGTDIKPLLVEGRTSDVHDAIPSHEKQNKIFGYKETPLQEGLQLTWQWAQEQGSQEYDVEVPEL